jgi:excisionase family DNA binding protein
MHPESPTQSVKRAYSVRDFCEAFSISRSRVYQLFAAGELAFVKFGYKTLIRADEAERWFNSLTNGGAK